MEVRRRNSGARTPQHQERVSVHPLPDIPENLCREPLRRYPSRRDTHGEPTDLGDELERRRAEKGKRFKTPGGKKQ
ncbi:hypothetical protein Sjap_012980 [Stephania japonica]|uniref:Uncharacterized protein n=1 Tax=Stephania japonica TaxID=461633 RepID=A0AAP0IYV0_9MAGN